MLLILVAYLGGVLTILSPCILPVHPFVFARSDQPFVRTGLPILIGMAVTFTAIASLAAIGGGWIVQANYYGRLAALLLMAVFGVTFLLPRFADHLTRPIVAIGSRMSQKAAGVNKGASFASSLLLGIATGLLWAPCAGPILGLLLTGAALNGASLGTSLVLLAYATGAVTSLLTRVSFASTNGIEQSLLDRLHPTKSFISQNAPQMAMTGTPTMSADPTMMMAATNQPQQQVRASNFASPGGAVPDQTQNYTAPAMLALNQWALAGTWQVGGEISYYFTLSRVAEILGEDEEWLYEISIDMFAEDGCVTIYSKGEDSITAFSEFGIENLRETILEERSSGRAPPKRPSKGST